MFKPQLRWVAARRVFTDTRAILANQGLDVSVAVGPHPEHGSLATVTVKGVPEAARESIEKQVHERLGPFVMRHEVAIR